MVFHVKAVGFQFSKYGTQVGEFLIGDTIVDFPIPLVVPALTEGTPERFDFSGVIVEVETLLVACCQPTFEALYCSIVDCICNFLFASVIQERLLSWSDDSAIFIKLVFNYG